MRTLRTSLVTMVALIGILAIVGATVAAAGGGGGGGSSLDPVRAASAPFHNLDVAMAAGYGPVKGCAKDPRGGMGQHYVKGDLVADPFLDTLRPEALVYEPRKGGGYQLVALEYLVLKDAWHATYGAKPPTLFGRRLSLVTAPNAYELPDFYEIHLWLWKKNPKGLYADWNPTVSCRGLPF